MFEFLKKLFRRKQRISDQYSDQGSTIQKQESVYQQETYEQTEALFVQRPSEQTEITSEQKPSRQEEPPAGALLCSGNVPRTRPVAVSRSLRDRDLNLSGPLESLQGAFCFDK